MSIGLKLFKERLINKKPLSYHMIHPSTMPKSMEIATTGLNAIKESHFEWWNSGKEIAEKLNESSLMSARDESITKFFDNNNVLAKNALSYVLGTKLSEDIEKFTKQAIKNQHKQEYYRLQIYDETMRLIKNGLPMYFNIEGSDPLYNNKIFFPALVESDVKATFIENTKLVRINGLIDRRIDGFPFIPYFSSKIESKEFTLFQNSNWEDVLEDKTELMPKNTLIYFQLDDEKITIDNKDREVPLSINYKSEDRIESTKVLIEYETMIDSDKPLKDKEPQTLWYLAASSIAKAIFDNTDKPIISLGIITNGCQYEAMVFQLNNMNFLDREIDDGTRNLYHIYPIAQNIYDPKTFEINDSELRKLINFMTYLYTSSGYRFKSLNKL